MPVKRREKRESMVDAYVASAQVVRTFLPKKAIAWQTQHVLTTAMPCSHGQSFPLSMDTPSSIISRRVECCLKVHTAMNLMYPRTSTTPGTTR